MEDVQFGGYETGALIGRGSFADVYEAYHPGLETRVAVKVLHPHLTDSVEVRERFIQEAQMLWRADSDRVIQVTHVDELPDGRPYFVMRYADLGTLDELIQRQIAEVGDLFSLRESVGLAIDLVDCLEALRDRDLVHRDLKPQNVLVKSIRTPDHQRTEAFGLPARERLVLADFGLAKILRDGTNIASQIGGTPAYMAPELGSLRTPVTWRADLFSLAVMLFEIMTGGVPWPARTIAHIGEVDLSVVRVREWRPDFPAQLDDVLQRALAFEPHDRHDDPQEFASELMALLAPPSAARSAPESDARSDVRALADTVSMTEAGLSDAVEAALGALDRPVRIGVIGGNRLSPVPLGLRLVGERPPPGEASLLGSVVVRLVGGPESLRATLVDGTSAVGDYRKDADGFLHLELPAAPWSIAELALSVPGHDLDDVEIIDVPHAVMRRDRDAVAAIYESLDVVVIGLPAERAAGFAAIDEVLALNRDGGPFAVVGVRQLGVSAESDHPVVLGTVPGDDTIELRVLLDEVLAGSRRADCRASQALGVLTAALAAAGRADAWESRIGEVHAAHPRLREIQLLREDLAGSRFAVGMRRRLHRVLGRQMSAARLGAVPDASVEALLSHAEDERRAWGQEAGVDVGVRSVLVESLERLQSSLSARIEQWP